MPTFKLVYGEYKELMCGCGHSISQHLNSCLIYNCKCVEDRDSIQQKTAERLHEIERELLTMEDDIKRLELKICENVKLIELLEKKVYDDEVL